MVSNPQTLLILYKLYL